MPEIARFFGIIIRMYFGDHPQPHFHAYYNQYEAVIDIKSGKVQGDLPPRILGFILEWLAIHRLELVENWELAKAKKPLKKIPGLDE